ncbi:MAG: hypothetical protein ACKOC5_19295 [Chloroflexota bacterium]
MHSGRRISRAAAALCLNAFYTLAFIFTPYWLLAPSLPGALAALLATAAAGTAWAWISAGELQFSIRRRDPLLFALLTAALLAVNIIPLTAGLPWRGDETFHFWQTQALVKGSYALLWAYALLAVPLLLYARTRRPKLAFLLVGVALPAAAAALWFAWPLDDMTAGRWLRYPFISYWLTAVPPSLAVLLHSPNHEILFRLLPFFSTVALAWLFQRSLPAAPTWLRLVWGLAVGLIPVVFYYSSILYLDLPAALLMLPVCLQADTLLTVDHRRLKQLPAWYALLLIGFIKETTLLFLGLFLALRWLARWQAMRRQGRALPGAADPAGGSAGVPAGDAPLSPLQALLGEMGVAFSILFPLATYLYLRSASAISRSFSLEFTGLFRLSSYGIVLRSLAEQFGPFLLLAACGGALLARRKEYVHLAFLALVGIGYPLFYLVDRESLYFLGYSRFNLFLLPPVLALSAPAAAWLTQRLFQAGQSKAPMKTAAVLAGAIQAVLIAANLALSPINMDRTRTRWMMIEHYYPYPQALKWLQQAHPRKKILFGGLNFGYEPQFYFTKFGWQPRYTVLPYRKDPDDAAALSASVQGLTDCRPCMLVFHVLGSHPPAIDPDAPNLKQLQVIKNSAHTLVIYRVWAP